MYDYTISYPNKKQLKTSENVVLSKNSKLFHI